jgi:hypothetical protein
LNLPVTPERVASVYAMLREWPPFSGWRLPPAEDVAFHVAKTNRWHAAWWIDPKGVHHVEVSEKKHSHLNSLIASVAHEMIHIRQRISRTETPNTEHNAAFLQCGKRVCRVLGFDYGQFNG